MLDIFNHLAVYLLWTSIFMMIGMGQIIHYKMEAIKFGLTASLCVFIAGEAIAWSIYYLSGAGV